MCLSFKGITVAAAVNAEEGASVGAGTQGGGKRWGFLNVLEPTERAHRSAADRKGARERADRGRRRGWRRWRSSRRKGKGLREAPAAQRRPSGPTLRVMLCTRPTPRRTNGWAASLGAAAVPARARWASLVRTGSAGRDRLRGAALEETEAAGGPEAQEEDEDEEEALPHSEAMDVLQEGLALVVQDPLLCDLPIQVTLEEVNSQIALEYGQAMTVRVCKMDGEVMPVVVVQSATVLDLKKAIQRYVQLKQEREGGIQHISWSYVWRTYHLTSAGEKLTEDKKKLRDYGIRNRDEVSFIKKLRQK
ncbi:hypothetical protein H8959_010333 [Pygathrix nigripes]